VCEEAGIGGLHGERFSEESSELDDDFLFTANESELDLGGGALLFGGKTSS
jgi:hypothetical protein